MDGGKSGFANVKERIEERKDMEAKAEEAFEGGAPDETPAGEDEAEQPAVKEEPE